MVFILFLIALIAIFSSLWRAEQKRKALQAQTENDPIIKQNIYAKSQAELIEIEFEFKQFDFKSNKRKLLAFYIATLIVILIVLVTDQFIEQVRVILVYIPLLAFAIYWHKKSKTEQRNHVDKFMKLTSDDLHYCDGNQDYKLAWNEINAIEVKAGSQYGDPETWVIKTQNQEIYIDSQDFALYPRPILYCLQNFWHLMVHNRHYPRIF